MSLTEFSQAPASTIPAPVPAAPKVAPKVSVFPKTQEVPETPDPLLVSILRTRRRHGTTGDMNFRLWLHSELRRMGHTVEVAVHGNTIVRTDEKSDTLFSCHVDTCHSEKECDGSSQLLSYDPTMGHLFLAPQQEKPAGCLGADDGVGIYIMLKMIAAKVPGTYVFHTAEEVGGQGSKALLTARKDWLAQFSRAVAFDRPNTTEVIVTQGGLDCASVEAGEALCLALNEHGMDFTVSHRGVFTDTKVYAGVIEECYNIGVGYWDQHTPKECLDVAHTEALLAACLKVDWDGLPVKRVPRVAAPPVQSNFNYPFPSGNFGAPSKKKKKAPAPFVQTPAQPVQYPTLFDELEGYSSAELAGICADTPDEAAMIIVRLKSRIKGLEAELDAVYTSLGVA